LAFSSKTEFFKIDFFENFIEGFFKKSMRVAIENPENRQKGPFWAFLKNADFSYFAVFS